MSAPTMRADVDEPIGIVISSGKREEPTPAFTAYEWAPAVEDREPAKTPPGS